MQKRSNQTKGQSEVNNKSQVWRLKLVLAGALLIMVMALAALSMPFLTATAASHALTVPSHVQSAVPMATPGTNCNPQPNCV